MKYLCFGWLRQKQIRCLTEDQQNTRFDRCFGYDDHLRASGYWASGEALQSAEIALTLYRKNGKLATTDGR